METGNQEIQNENTTLIVKPIVKKQEEDKMYTNPFLFTMEENDLYSLEDFYIKYNENYVKFEDFVRNDTITDHERKQVIGEQIVNWKKDVEQLIFSVFKESKDAVFRCRKGVVSKLNFKTYFLLILGIIIPSVLLLDLIPIIAFPNEYYKWGAIVMIALSCIGIILGIVYNHSRRKFFNVLAKHKSLHQKYSRQIFKKLKKTCKYVKKYYTKNFKKQILTKEPLPIEKINEIGEKLANLSNSTANIHDAYTKLFNKRNNSSFCYVLTKLLAHFTFIVSFLVLVALLIMNILKK